MAHFEITIKGIKKNNGIMALQLKNLSKNIVLDYSKLERTK